MFHAESARRVKFAHSSGHFLRVAELGASQETEIGSFVPAR